VGQRVLIEITRFGWMLGLGKRWTPGEKLRLLFAGYNGNRNTGLTCVCRNAPPDSPRSWRGKRGFSVMTQNFDLTRGYFESTRQVHSADVFPAFSSSEVRANHGA